MNPQHKFVWEGVYLKTSKEMPSSFKPFVLAFMLEYNPNKYVNTVLNRLFSPPTEKWEAKKPTPPQHGSEISGTVAFFPPATDQ